MNRLLRSFIKTRSYCRLNSTSEGTSSEETISYMKSKAAKEYKAANAYFVYPEEGGVWPSNSRVFQFCALVLGVYCMFREPNDLDEQLDRPLFDRMPHLERPLLESSLINSYNQGLPTQHIVERLKKLEAQGK